MNKKRYKRKLITEIDLKLTPSERKCMDILNYSIEDIFYNRNLFRTEKKYYG